MSYSISLRFGPLELTPKPGLTLFMGFVAAVCLAAGIWQLDRARQKAALAEVLAARSGAAPVALASVALDRREAARYRRIEARGRYLPQYQFTVPSNRQTRTGAYVVTPFALANDGRVLLVNRGWRPAGAEPMPPEGALLSLTGQLVPPAAPALRLGPANSDETQWQRPWLFADPELFADKSGLDALPWVLLLDPDQPEGFGRDWPLPRPQPGMHIGYAIQWFAFAIMAVVIWGLLSRKRSGDERPG